MVLKGLWVTQSPFCSMPPLLRSWSKKKNEKRDFLTIEAEYVLHAEITLAIFERLKGDQHIQEIDGSSEEMKEVVGRRASGPRRAASRTRNDNPIHFRRISCSSSMYPPTWMVMTSKWKAITNIHQSLKRFPDIYGVLPVGVSRLRYGFMSLPVRNTHWDTESRVSQSDSRQKRKAEEKASQEVLLRWMSMVTLVSLPLGTALLEALQMICWPVSMLEGDR